MTIVSTGNIGIGTSEPTNKLHIRDDTTGTTALTIQNNNTTITTLPTEVVVAETTPTIIGTDRCIQFTYYSNSTYYTSKDYTFTTTENLICDISPVNIVSRAVDGAIVGSFKKLVIPVLIELDPITK